MITVRVILKYHVLVLLLFETYTNNQKCSEGGGGGPLAGLVTKLIVRILAITKKTNVTHVIEAAQCIYRLRSLVVEYLDMFRWGLGSDCSGLVTYIYKSSIPAWSPVFIVYFQLVRPGFKSLNTLTSSPTDVLQYRKKLLTPDTATVVWLFVNKTFYFRY